MTVELPPSHTVVSIVLLLVVVDTAGATTRFHLCVYIGGYHGLATNDVGRFHYVPILYNSLSQ
jgi:hypothetical protein